MRVAAPNIENFSTTEPIENIIEAGKHYGQDFEIGESQPGLAEEAAPTITSTPAKEDDKAPKEPVVDPNEGKTAAELETARKQAAQGEWSDEDRAKHKKILRQLDKATGEWRKEQGTNGALERQISDLQRQITELGTKAPAAETVVEEQVSDAPKPPVRPKVPSRDMALYEYDDAKYNAAFSKYDEAMAKYDDDRAQYIRAEAVREVMENQQREQAEQSQAQYNADWQAAKEEIPGLEAKLQSDEATKSNVVSPAMNAVLRGSYSVQERALVTNYLVDHIDEAERICGLTLAKSAKLAPGENEYLISVATKELTRLLAKAEKPSPAAAAPKPAAPATPAPPAKPKPPVSAAPAPIEPVGGRTSGGGVNLADPTISTETYQAQRQAERRASQARGGR
jgi:hypothetical protein